MKLKNTVPGYVDPEEHTPNKVAGVVHYPEHKPMYRCLAPDGTEVILAQHNARDWERRGGGHKILGKITEAPAPVAKPEPVKPAPGPEVAQSGAEGEGTNATEDAMRPLTELRDALDALGVPYDKRWGLKKLTEALKIAQEEAAQGEE